MITNDMVLPTMEQSSESNTMTPTSSCTSLMLSNQMTNASNTSSAATAAAAAAATSNFCRAMNPASLSAASVNQANQAVGLQNIKDLILLQQQQLQQAQLQQQIAHQQAHQLASQTLTPDTSPRQGYPINPLMLRGAYPTNGELK